MSRLLRIGALSRAAGISVSALRFYESQGLLVPAQRSAGNYRLYDEAAVDQARFIRQAQQLGFALQDIGDLLRLLDRDAGGHTGGHTGGDRGRDSGRDSRPNSRGDVRSLAARQVAAMEAQIRRLSRMRDVLAAAVADCDGLGPARGCPVIASIRQLPEQGEGVRDV